MSSKKEIIEALTNTGLLDLEFNSFEDNNEDDYKFCINYFKKWCKYLGYKISYESFCYFLLEYDNEGISILTSRDVDYLVFNSEEAAYIINLSNCIWCINGLSARIKKSPFYELL